VLDGGPNIIEEVQELTGGGAHVVIDFVGELGVENICWKMLRQGGQYYIVGYGGKIEIPTVHMIINEIQVGGSLVGNYPELVELMELNAEGRVKMHSSQYRLDDINSAIEDFKAANITGRAVIVP
jgi:NAD+-dependent secondary alcohol dehydrogenase Adh1